MQYILEQGVCHGTVLNSCHTSSAAKKNPLTEIQEGELYLCLEHRTVRVRERIINLTSKEFDTGITHCQSQTCFYLRTDYRFGLERGL